MFGGAWFLIIIIYYFPSKSGSVWRPSPSPLLSLCQLLDVVLTFQNMRCLLPAPGPWHRLYVRRISSVGPILMPKIAILGAMLPWDFTHTYLLYGMYMYAPLLPSCSPCPVLLDCGPLSVANQHSWVDGGNQLRRRDSRRQRPLRPSLVGKEELKLAMRAWEAAPRYGTRRKKSRQTRLGRSCIAQLGRAEPPT